jgi:hypothetical protein
MQLTKKLSSKRNLLRGGSKSKKNKNNRKSPSESATSMSEGTIHHGNDGQLWVVKKAANGTPRWMPYTSVELNGFKALTVDYLAKNIGKEIEIYERYYMDKWPDKNESWYMKYKFITDGNLQIGKKIINNWLKDGDITKPIKDKKKMYYLLHRNNNAEVNFLIMDNTYINVIASQPYKHQAYVKA